MMINIKIFYSGEVSINHLMKSVDRILIQSCLQRVSICSPRQIIKTVNLLLPHQTAIPLLIRLIINFKCLILVTRCFLDCLSCDDLWSIEMNVVILDTHLTKQC